MCDKAMDLDQLRQARLQKYSGVTTTLVSTAEVKQEPSVSMGDQSSSAMASADGPIQEAAAVVPFSYSGIMGILTEVRDHLLQLPEKIASALAASASAGGQQPVPQTAPVPATQPAPLPAPLSPLLHSHQGGMQPSQLTDYVVDVEPTEAEGSQEVDLFAETDTDPCGVCHMPVLGNIYAFDNCGHYPFCTSCVDTVKTQIGPLQCPYCKSKGKTLKLNFEQ